ncbi:MAG: DUF1573 domain-containing protein [Prevotellaceae bacterium]|nr:DUF1573 domain-containing protein [Prevotellaceae bacterium]
MNKIFNVLWFILLLFISGVNAGAQKIEFEKTVHDFGLVPSILGPVTYSFKFKNVGDKPLSIKSVSSSCGCTSPDWTKAPVQPGETGEVKATYTSTNSLSSFNKRLTVHANGSPSTVIISIKGVVTKDINAAFPDSIGKLKIKDRRDLVFPQILSSQTSHVQTVEVANLTGGDINLSFENVPEYLTVNSVPVVAPKTRAQINVSVDGTKVKKFGYITDRFTVKSDDAKEQINVSCVVAEDIKASENPPVCKVDSLVVDLGVRPEKENKISESLEIRNTGASDLVIKNFATDNASFVLGTKKELKIKPGKTGTVKYSAKNLPKGDHSANIYLTSNDPEMPVLNFTVKLKIE